MTTFANWLTERESLDISPVLTPPWSVVPTIAAAGAKGMSRAELGKAIGLEPHLLNRLLSELISIGWITATEEGGWTIYRARHSWLGPLGDGV